MRRLLGTSSLLMVVAACSQSEPLPLPNLEKAPVVYGVDDRTEWFAVADPDTKELARSAIAAMIDAEQLVPNDAGGYDLMVFETLGQSNGLCADQPYWQQPSVSICSGALIDDQLLLTAGHCVSNLADCAGFAWVFDYRYEAEGVLAPISNDSVYRCVDLVTNGFEDVGEDYDFAIVQLDRPVVGRTPARVREADLVEDGEALTIMGFPNGIPMKVAPNGAVVSPGNSGSAAFVGQVDAFYGNSGSSVFGADMTVAGILVTGADDYVSEGRTCAVLQVLDEEDGEEVMTYARHAVNEMCEKGFPSVTLCGDGKTECGDGWCTASETVESCPGDCDGLFAVPATWTCNPGFFDAEDGCDCACGAFDPDCADPEERVFGCSPGSACLETGVCEVPVPEAWTCDKDEYGEGDDCDCGCGVYDPDCDDPEARVRNCVRGTECLPDGTCEFPIPDEWFCSQRWYAQGDGCDCGCGARDPDCDDEDQQVYGCVPGSECTAEGACVEPIPEGWLCASELFGEGENCDCNCGARDPDCDDDLDVLNCGSGEGCDVDGRCTTVVVEPQPEVAPETSPEVGPEPQPETVETSSPDSDTDPTTATAEAEGKGGTKDDDGCAGGGLDPSVLMLAFGALALGTRRFRRG